MSAKPEPLSITVREICDRMGVSRSTLLRYRRLGVFPCEPIDRHGHRLKFNRADVMAWIEEREKAGRLRPSRTELRLALFDLLHRASVVGRTASRHRPPERRPRSLWPPR